jgi:SWI/SNF-related matrix-associated actin-dependent regulator of chromatin subfamily B protein 1
MKDSKDNKEFPKTFGEKPVSFVFENDTERYYIGQEVGNYLRYFRGTIYKKYPSLWRRLLTLDERRQLIQQGKSEYSIHSLQIAIVQIFKSVNSKTGWAENSLPTNVTLLRASEVDDVLSGDDKKYKAIAVLEAGGHNTKT